MKRKWRFHTKFYFYFFIHGFNLQIWKRGDLFPITKASHSYIFLSTLVNDTQGLMCLKNRSNFSYKLHPIPDQAILAQNQSPTPVWKAKTNNNLPGSIEKA